MEKFKKSMRRNLGRALFTAFLLPSVVQADESAVQWIDVTETADFSWSVKQNSLAFVHVGGKKNVGFGYVYQKLNRIDQTYTYGRVFVTLDACKKNFGYVIYNDTSGAFIGKDQFIRNGTTVADELGTLACMALDRQTGKVSPQEKEDAWVVASETPQKDLKLWIKVDTIRKRNYNGKLAITALHSEYAATNNSTKYGEYAFHVADCKKGIGKLYTLDFDGKLRDTSDVALDGKSLGSGVASMLCKKAT